MPSWQVLPSYHAGLSGESRGRQALRAQTPGGRLHPSHAMTTGAIGYRALALRLRSGVFWGNPSFVGQRGGCCTRSLLSFSPIGLTCWANGQPQASPTSQTRRSAVCQGRSVPTLARCCPQASRCLSWILSGTWRAIQTLLPNSSDISRNTA